jgi:hypothetical protein
MVPVVVRETEHLHSAYFRDAVEVKPGAGGVSFCPMHREQPTRLGSCERELASLAAGRRPGDHAARGADSATPARARRPHLKVSHPLG